jgi:hypothetical protein
MNESSCEEWLRVDSLVVKLVGYRARIPETASREI